MQEDSHIQRTVMRQGLQVVLTALGAVAVVFGGLTVLAGAGGVVDGGRVSASVDSELRFYAAWYLGAGVLMLRSVRRVEAEGSLIRLIGAVFLIAAAARVLSMVALGTPHPLFLALMVIEFAIPVVIVPWQGAVARRAVEEPAEPGPGNLDE
jgi:hypothetical protein